MIKALALVDAYNQYTKFRCWKRRRRYAVLQ